MENETKTRIAAVGDVHVRETDKGKWIEYFKEVSNNADILVICGDLLCVLCLSIRKPMTTWYCDSIW